MKYFFLTFILFALANAVSAQEGHVGESPATTHEESFKNFRMAFLISHTAVPSRENRDHLFIPSWGMDLEYWFNHQWGLGLHSDIELQTFVIEENHLETLEREYPLVTTLDVLFKPVSGLVLLAGPGYEFEKEEDYKLLRFGVEYEIEFGRHWDISPTVFYDTRMDAYDTWSIALGIGKRF